MALDRAKKAKLPSEKIIQIRCFIYKLQDDLVAEANSQNIVLNMTDLKSDSHFNKFKHKEYLEMPETDKEFLYI